MKTIIRANKLKELLRKSTMLDDNEFCEAMALLNEYENKGLIIRDSSEPQDAINQLKITSYEFHFWASISARIRLEILEDQERALDLQIQRSVRYFTTRYFDCVFCFN